MCAAAAGVVVSLTGGAGLVPAPSGIDDRLRRIAMHVQLATVLILTALLASLVLAVEHRDRVVAGVAVLASGLEALIAFDVVSVSVRGLSLGLVLAVALTLAGAILWSRSAGKGAVTAATVVTVMGGLQVFLVLR